MGVSWFAASLGVFLRDVGHTTGIVTTIMLFLSPVFFPVSALPEEYRVLFALNPLTYIIEQGRDVLIWGKPMDWPLWALHLGIGVLVAWLGLFWFQNTRRGFADVL
jgi:lipopolysaccharide transport system permease protein